MTAYAFYHSVDLPWTISEEDQRRFRKIRRRVFIFCLLLAVIMPFLPVSKIERDKAETVPPRLAKLVLERKKARPPAPARRPELKTEKKVLKPKKRVKQKKIAKKKVQTARQRAQRAGLLAHRGGNVEVEVSAVSGSPPNSTRGSVGCRVLEIRRSS